ncbi:MAG: V-type ATP synthase subunit F [Clostridiales bacterium]|jgi:V/A-type H+-transporting ATPase subunit F|nr:V-type ATP synthase subunit F [Clostridiales bacterium]
MKIYLISDNVDTRTGLRLVGVDGAVVHTQDELKAQLDKVVSDKDIGIVLIMEKLSKQFPDIMKEIKLTMTVPLIVEIPDRHGTGRTKDFLAAYVRDAIGVKLE